MYKENCLVPHLNSTEFNLNKYIYMLKWLYFFSFSFFYFYLFYFWLCWVFITACSLSLLAASRGYSSLRCTGFSLRWLLLWWSTGSRHVGFGSCGACAQQLWLAGSRAQAQQLWHMGLVAPRHVGSSRTRAGTRVPCIGRRILNHCAIRAARDGYISYTFLL